MAKKLYLIKVGEISLKGLNRAFFEKRLRHNIKDKLRPYRSNCEKQKGRLFFYIEEECPDSIIEAALSTTFGVTGYARAIVCQKDMETIKAKVKEILPSSPFSKGKGSFKVEARREDKSFTLSSYEICLALADVVSDCYPDLTVKMKEPDFVLTCEIRSQAYLYTSTFPGQGGLPTGTAGKGMLLLSGGIDSPVAAYLMAKRGLKMDAIYFHAYPYTSEMALEKVKRLSSLIAPYLQGLRLYVVPFTEQQIYIRDHAFEEETTLMFRASMMGVSDRLSARRGAECIVTGEALSQVASQTLPSLAFTDSMSDNLVLRPLIGMDKQEIVNISKRIGTYETSILPYEDCCVIFSPKHPITSPIKEITKAHFTALEMDEMLDKAVAETQVFTFDANGCETTDSEAAKKSE